MLEVCHKSAVLYLEPLSVECEAQVWGSGDARPAKEPQNRDERNSQTLLALFQSNCERKWSGVEKISRDINFLINNSSNIGVEEE